MKNVTIVFAAVFALLSVDVVGAVAHPDWRAENGAAVVNDIPLARPAVRISGPSAALALRGPEVRYFYAPGSGPRCALTIKRVQGRLYQSCE